MYYVILWFFWGGLGVECFVVSLEVEEECCWVEECKIGKVGYRIEGIG